MEKQLILTQLRAKFTKSFETFGKMDPYLVFYVNRNQQKRTETAKDSGKQPRWNKTIILHYNEQTSISVKAIEVDKNTNQLIGQGTINVKQLKAQSQIQITLMGQQGQEIGIISGNYSLKTLPPTPILIVKNIACEFYKQAKFLLKTKPFVRIQSVLQQADFQIKKQADSKSIVWNESQKLKIKDSFKIQFKLLDSDDQNSQIFSIDIPIKDFRTYTGTRKYNVNDKKFDPLGILSFQYETLNFINKEDSVRNQQKMAKDQTQLSQIQINKIKGQLKQGGNQIYMKIIVGPNKIITKQISDKSFQIQVNGKIYAQSKQNKIIFAVFSKDLNKDDVIGYGNLSLEGLTSQEQNIVKIINKDKKEIGKLFIDLFQSKVTSKTIIIQNILLKTYNSNDNIGQSDSFFLGRIGGWVTRTQTVSGQQISFKKSLQIFYSNQQSLQLEIFDEDIKQNQKVLNVSMKLKDLDQKKGGYIKVALSSNSSKKKGGDISFDYRFINNETNNKKKTFSQSFKKKQETIKKSQSVQQKNVKRQVTQFSIKKNSIDESPSFKLPSIYEKRYGDNIYNISSSATLQRSIHAFSMPKAQRFRDRPKYQGSQPSYYVQSSFKFDRSKGPHIGFGQKKIIPDHVIKNMKENPGPNVYGNLDRRQYDYNKKGKTFGASRVSYEKVFVPNQKKFLKNLSKK